MTRFWIPVLAVVVLSCTGKNDGERSITRLIADTPEGAAVESRLKAYYDDMSNRDWQKYRTHFWERATLTTAWQQPGDSMATVDVTTIDDFIRETPQGPDSQPVFEERMKDSHIKVQGNIAEAWVTMRQSSAHPTV
jgi:hypothetical protein